MLTAWHAHKQYWQPIHFSRSMTICQLWSSEDCREWVSAPMPSTASADSGPEVTSWVKPMVTPVAPRIFNTSRRIRRGCSLLFFFATDNIRLRQIVYRYAFYPPGKTNFQGRGAHRSVRKQNGPIALRKDAPPPIPES